jgi:hypothetical protein
VEPHVAIIVDYTKKPGVAGTSFLVLGILMLRIASTLLRIGFIPCLVIHYPRYSIFSEKNLDLAIGYSNSHTSS